MIPTWLLTVVTGQRRAAQEIDRTLPAWLRPDLWAVVRIFDRAFGAFIRGSCWWPRRRRPHLRRIAGPGVAGLAGGLPGGAGGGGGPVPAGAAAGALVSAVLGALVGFSASPGTGLAVLGTYYLVQRLVGAFVGSRVERRVSDLHPTILVLVIVALSQLGWQWIFLAAPVSATPATCGATRSSAWAIPAGRARSPAPSRPRRPEPARVCWRPARAALVYRRTQETRGHGAGAKRPGRAPADPGPGAPGGGAEAFSRRQSGRTPIVVLPERASRISLQLLRPAPWPSPWGSPWASSRSASTCSCWPSWWRPCWWPWGSTGPSSSRPRRAAPSWRRGPTTA